MEEIKFYDWTVTVEKERILFQKGKRGLVIYFPAPYQKFKTKRSKEKRKIKDWDGCRKGEDDKLKNMDILRFDFVLKEKENYLLWLVRYNNTVQVIHGYKSWDGDKYGFLIEGLA